MPLNIHQRILEVMKEISYVQKEKKNGMKYSIVSHDAVTALVRPSLVRHGITYFPAGLDVKQTGNRTEVVVRVQFTNADDPADLISVISVGYGIDDQDKGPGKALSYAVKYALLKAFGLESGDDPDLEQNARLKTLDMPAPAAPVVVPDIPYTEMNHDQRVAYWSKEWRGVTLESAFDGLVNQFRSQEPEGSPVRAALSEEYVANKRRLTGRK